jgi:hypothetical protein
MNAAQGLMVSWSRYGPAYMGPRQQPPVHILPALKNGYDIAFLKWRDFAQDRSANLKYFIASNIVNAETLALISRATDLEIPHDCELMDWDARRTFLPSHEEYKVLIASQNGRAAALLLIAHKAVFGEHTVIESADVWCEGDSEEMMDVNMLFTYKKDYDVGHDTTGMPPQTGRSAKRETVGHRYVKLM